MVLAGKEYTIQPCDLLEWHELDKIITFQALAKPTNQNEFKFLNLIGNSTTIAKHVKDFKAHNPDYKEQFGGVYCDPDLYKEDFDARKAALAKKASQLASQLGKDLCQAILACQLAEIPVHPR